MLLLLFFCRLLFTLSSAFPPKFSSSSALLPGDSSKTPRRALSGAALSGSSALSLSLSRLFVPPRRVSRMLAKTEHLRDERAIHYRAAPPLLCRAHKGSLSQLPSLHRSARVEIHSEPRGWKVDANKRFCARHRLLSHSVLGINVHGKPAECISSPPSSTKSCQCHLRLKC